MASWYLGVYEIAENTSLATALDVVNALKKDLPGMSIVSHLEDACQRSCNSPGVTGCWSRNYPPWLVT